MASRTDGLSVAHITAMKVMLISAGYLTIFRARRDLRLLTSEPMLFPHCKNRTAGAAVAMRRFLLPLIVLSAISGCTTLETALKWKTPLNKISISSIAVTLRDKNGLAPGHSGQLMITVTEPSGTVLCAGGPKNNQIMWDDVAITGTVVSVKQRGVISMPDDPRISDGKVGHVVVTVPSHPDVRAEMDIPIRYDDGFTANFSGSNGMDGISGMDGIDGSMGSSGSMVPGNPSPGGRGADGTNGSDGQDGGMGASASQVQVKIALQDAAKKLLQIEVDADHQQKFFLVDPSGGSLLVKADGGKGGTGGRGGRGGKGGMGGVGSPSGMQGMDGHEGRSGFDGVAGHGGLITVIYDPAVKPYLKAIHLSSWNGPRPIFIESAVTSLW